MLRVILIALSLVCASLAQAQVPMTGAGKGAPGGALPTLTGAGSAVNASCAFVTTCTITTTANVTTGTVVAIAGVKNGGTPGSISGISICGTSLTMDVNPASGAPQYIAAMGSHSVTGGASCTITITYSSTNTIENGGVAWVTLNNLSSSTPGTSCSAGFDISQNSPYPCAGGLTVSAGGYGIVGLWDNNVGAVSIPANSSVTQDSTANGSNVQITIGHVTANCNGTDTNPSCEFGAGNFSKAYTIGEPFR